MEPMTDQPCGMRCEDRTPPCYVIGPHVHPDAYGVWPGVRVTAAPGDVIPGMTIGLDGMFAAVRERHRPRPFGLDTRCWECNRPYPCPTIKILDGVEVPGREDPRPAEPP